ncbi:hypothetical protein TCAL_16754 [Tigriopus californicus]|uniref:Nuclear receptor domain-containing protein n=1 Tax=Tigriopus californicus TaxID=6832 RepID=A0A553PSB0_TIGCA|nr:uncharacterized protein LOC131892418 [Tigriopus californicus]XP_059098270.1 uncharacterized protein LOC131892418 [Tigriopus californicus]TRY80570.1 hypothetical protein TCAL_16754 [Tigriopus californicus]
MTSEDFDLSQVKVLKDNLKRPSGPQMSMQTVCPICKFKSNDKHCFHYGGVSCYSCRAFFRRAHQGTKEPSFKCKRNNQCDITEKTRRKCQKCRYELCLNAGMDPSLVLDDDQKKVRFRNYLRKKKNNNVKPGFDGSEESPSVDGESSASPLTLSQIAPLEPAKSGGSPPMYDYVLLNGPGANFNYPTTAPGVVPMDETKDLDVNEKSMDELVDSMQQIYFLAMAQIHISPKFIQDLVEFHSSENSNLSKFDFGEHIFRIGTHFKQFAHNQKHFKALGRADQLSLLEKNTSLFVLYILAQYFGAFTGEEQLQWLLDVNMPQNYSNSKPQQISFPVFNKRLGIFKPSVFDKSVSDSDFDVHAQKIAKVGITLRFSGIVANLILFNNGTQMHLDHRPSIQKQFDEALDLLRHAHQQIDSHISLQDILSMIRNLDHLQGVFNTNADWQTECGSDSCPNLPYIDLKLPYTKEEESWVEQQVSWFQEAFVSMPIAKELIQDFFSYTFHNTIPPRIIKEGYQFFSDRMSRSMHLHQEFVELTPQQKKDLWRCNSMNAMAICFARLEACDHGYGQAKILFGGLADENSIKQRIMAFALPHLIKKCSVRQVNKSMPVLNSEEVEQYCAVVERMKKVLLDDLAFKLILIIVLFQGDFAKDSPLARKRDAYTKFLERRLRKQGLLGLLEEQVKNSNEELVGIKVIMQTIWRMRPLIYKLNNTVIQLNHMST